MSNLSGRLAKLEARTGGAKPITVVNVCDLGEEAAKRAIEQKRAETPDNGVLLIVRYREDA